MKIVLFAMDSNYARAVLARLVDAAGVELAALVVPAATPAGFPGLRVAGRGGHADMAQRVGAVIIDHRGNDELAQRLSPIQPDVVAVACYPRRLTPRIAAVARTACLNLHPSLLPRYRGPDPLFWQLRAGEAHAGVTIHRVESRLDAGAIVVARPIILPSGWRRAALDERLGEAAASLFLDWAAGGGGPCFEPQDGALATTQPLPSTADRIARTDWRVDRAFDFLRGAAPPGAVFRINDGRHNVAVRDAIEMAPEEMRGIRVGDDGLVSAGFAGGVIRARAVRDARPVPAPVPGDR